MTAQNGLTQEQTKELQSRLKLLSEKDKDAPFLLASRAALRAFPLLAWPNNEYFLYWPEPKVENLLTVWWCALAGYQKNAQADIVWTSHEILNIRQRAHLASQSEHEAVPIYIEVLKAAEYTGLSSDRASNIANSISSAVKATSCVKALMYDVLQKDLKISEDGGFEALLKSPLWQNTPLSKEYIDLADVHFQKSFRLLEQSYRQSNHKAADLIHNVYPAFMKIVTGNPDLLFIKICLKQLSDYFSGQETVGDENLSKVQPNDTGGLSVSSSVEGSLRIEEFVPTSKQSAHGIASSDQLDRTKLIGVLANMLLESSNSHHQTIGLLGHWGSGKSSVIALLKEKLLEERDKQPFLFAEFNAWEYEHTENLQAGIAQEMLKALSSQAPKTKQDKIDSEHQDWIGKAGQWLSWKWRRAVLACRFAWNIQGLKLLMPAFLALIAFFPWLFQLGGVDNRANSFDWNKWLSSFWSVGFMYPTWLMAKKLLASPYAKELHTYLKLPDYGEHLGTIPVMREHIKKLAEVRLGATYKNKGLASETIKTPQKRLLYVVDDLDRCSPEGIVKVLEAVRMVLDLKHVTVIIAVDQRIALAALALHYNELENYHPTGDARQIARDYLAKVLLQSIELTEPDEGSVDKYLSDLWGQAKSENETVPLKKNSDNQSKDLKRNPNPPSEFPLDQKADKEEIEKPETIDSTSEVTPRYDTEIVYLERLSDAQQTAFKYWVHHFGLTNPRQLKRLNNSYNFLRNFYAEDRIPEVLEDPNIVLSEYDFPMLATLCAMEFINNLVDKDERVALMKTLIDKEDDLLNDEGNKKDVSKLDETVIRLAHSTLTASSGQEIIAHRAVKPFVLPALDSLSTKGGKYLNSIKDHLKK